MVTNRVPPRTPADHKLMVTPGQKRLIISCTVCQIIEPNMKAVTLEALRNLEEGHQYNVGLQILNQP